MVNQSPTGELEVLQGKSSYTFAGNWKLQNENGLDGYHVSTVHYNYVSTVQHRQQVNSSKGAELDTLDYSKLGAGDSETDDGWFSFKNYHSVLFSDMPNPTVRPGYSTVMPYMVEKYGEKYAEWAMHRLRNLNLYPSLFLWIKLAHSFVLFALWHGIKLKSSVNVLELKANLLKHAVIVFASLKISLMCRTLVHQTI